MNDERMAKVEQHLAVLRDEDERRRRHAEARKANLTPGGGFRVLRAEGLVPVVVDGRLAIVLQLVPIRGPRQPGYFETLFFEDIEALA